LASAALPLERDWADASVGLASRCNGLESTLRQPILGSLEHLAFLEPDV
jgi:hypothetical protein